jgi:hypothetical protein
VAVGEVASFTATELIDVEGRREVSAFTDLVSGGVGVVAAQDFSNDADLVTGIADREAELHQTTVTLSEALTRNAGTGFRKGNATTAALTVAPTGVTLRMPITLIDDADLRAGCVVTVRAPMGRATFATTEAQVTAWEASQVVELDQCLASVAGAAAVDVTTVAVDFSRAVDPASVLANGSQFEIAGLTVTGAAVNGRRVTLTTAAQTGGTAYTVEVASTVLDIFGSLYDESASTADFTGFQEPATLLVNEVHPNLANGCDLVELLVTAPGTLSGISIAGRAGDIASQGLPSVTVATGDLIVIHANTASTTCNPAQTTFETAVGQFTAATDFAGAFDIYVAGTLTGTNGAIILSTAAGIMDAVPYANNTNAGNACSSGGASRTSFDGIVAAGEWLTAAGGTPVTPSSNDNYCVDSAGGQTFGTASTGLSLQRLNRVDTDRRTDWTMANGTVGSLNAGQE